MKRIKISSDGILDIYAGKFSEIYGTSFNGILEISPRGDPFGDIYLNLDKFFKGLKGVRIRVLILRKVSLILCPIGQNLMDLLVSIREIHLNMCQNIESLFWYLDSLRISKMNLILEKNDVTKYTLDRLLTILSHSRCRTIREIEFSYKSDFYGPISAAFPALVSAELDENMISLLSKVNSLMKNIANINMKVYTHIKNACFTILMIRRFRNSILGRIDMNLIRKILLLIWESRYDDEFYENFVPRIASRRV